MSMESALHAKVDVVVVSYNSEDHLRACIEDLSRDDRYNVIVVDNASVDGSRESIADLRVEILAELRNHGFSRACNKGWKQGRAPFVLFVNPDTRIDSSAVEALVRVLEGETTVGVAGPRILDEEGGLMLSQFRFPRIRSTLSEALYLYRLFPRRAWATETVAESSAYVRAQDVEWLSGACLLVRREILNVTGGFDERFFMYSEDTELCLAVRALGLRVRFEPSAVIVHVGGGSATRSSLLPVRTRSRLAYVTKNCSRYQALAHRFGFAVEAVSHACLTRGGWAARRGYLSSLRVPVSESASEHDPARGVSGVPA